MYKGNQICRGIKIAGTSIQGFVFIDYGNWISEQGTFQQEEVGGGGGAYRPGPTEKMFGRSSKDALKNIVKTCQINSMSWHLVFKLFDMSDMCSFLLIYILS